MTFISKMKVFTKYNTKQWNCETIIVKINILTVGFVKMKYLQSILLNMPLVPLIRSCKITDE